jgi:hypothetical protein
MDASRRSAAEKAWSAVLVYCPALFLHRFQQMFPRIGKTVLLQTAVRFVGDGEFNVSVSQHLAYPLIEFSRYACMPQSFGDFQF